MRKGIRSAILIATLLFSIGASAQVYVSEYHQNEGNPGTQNTETDAASFSTWNVILNGGLDSTVWSSAAAIPFNFDFFGQPVSHFRMSTNGLVTFDTLSTFGVDPLDTNVALPTNLIPDNSIACWWDAFATNPPTGSNDEGGWKVFGNAPNRQLWIKWFSYEWASLSFVYTAVVLEETSNKIYLVDQYGSAPGSMEATVGLQENSTSAFFIGASEQFSGNGSGTPDNDFWEFTLLDSLDAGVSAVIEPSGSLCPGLTDIQVEVSNYGFTTIDSLQIGFTVNGSAPTVINFTGLSLDTLEQDTLSLGSFNFLAGVVYDFEIYTIDPNGATDNAPGNDTLIINGAQTGLNGTYSIDGATPTGGTNFQTFGDAAAVLNNFGVCGPVVFNIATGSFSESVALVDVPGVSAVNTITFNGAGAGLSTLTHDGTNNATFSLSGTKHVTAKNMTFQTTSTSVDAWCFHLSNSSDSVTIDSCAFVAPVTTTTDIAGLVASNSLTFETSEGDNANYLTVMNSSFEGGEFGIHLEGDATTYSVGNKIMNCSFLNHDDNGIEVDNMEDLTITGNTMDSITSSAADGIYLVDVNGYNVSGNTIRVEDYGIYIEDGNDGFTPSTVSQVNNNMVISTGDYAIYLNDFESTQVYHNTVNSSNVAIRINDQVDADIRNNIAYSIAGKAFESLDALTGSDIVNYNYYYSEATNAFTIGGTNYTDLAAWVSAEPAYNANSYFADPVFVDVSSDLHMNNDFIAYNGGINLGVTTDIDGQSRPLNGIVEIGADEYVLTVAPLDLGVTQIIAPVGQVCAGTENILLEVVNGGFNVIDSVNILFSVNGSPAVNIPFGGLSIATGSFDTLDLGVFNFAAGVTYDFTLYSANPNGGNDTTTSNDTIEIFGIQTGLVGNYTIDGATSTGGTNYQTFADAAQDLNAFGVCGAVVFDVAAGTYSESLELNLVQGVSSVNTITFDGGDAATAVLTHDGTNNATFRLFGTKHVTIKNLTLETTSSSADAWCLHLSNASDSVTVDSCNIIMPIGSTDDVQGIVASNSLTFETSEGNNANYLTVTNSYFEGGETGIHLEGGTAVAAYNAGNHIEGNVFRFHDDEAIDVDKQQQLSIIGNDVDSLDTGADGIYLLDINDYTIESNRIIADDYSLYILDGNDGFTVTSASTVINNMIVSTADYGIYLNDFENTHVYHNSVVGVPAIRINDQINANIRNNIFIGVGDFAFESDDTLATSDTVDFNIYNSNNANMFDVSVNLYADLTAWQVAEVDYNINSIEGTPAFVGATDLHVVDGLANDAGDFVDVIVDIDGDSRPAGASVDIGADEYTPAANDLWSIAALGLNGQICADDSFYFEVVVFNGGSTVQTLAPLVIDFTGAITATLNDTIATIAAFEFDTLLVGPLNTQPGGIIDGQLVVNLTGDENNDNDTITFSFEVSALPAAPIATNDTICPADTALLVASSGQSSYTWYASEFSMTPLFVGDSFEVAGISGDTSLWVSTNASVSGSAGPIDDSFGTSANFTGITAQYMEFDALTSMTLDSVRVFPNGAGDVEVLLQDNTGALLQSVTVPVTNTNGEMIPVGFTVAAGSYRLAAGAGTTTGGLVRNSTGANYPYTAPGIVSITGNSFGSAYYYFYYDWKVSSAGCESDRVEAFISVDSISVDLGVDTAICVEDVITLDAGAGYDSYLWPDNSTAQTFAVNMASVVGVTVSNANGCEATDSVAVSNYAIPSVDLGPDTIVCSGITLDAGANFNSYVWQDNSTNQTLIANTTGQYSVTVEDVNTCEGSDTVEVTVNPIPVVNLGGDLEYCVGDSSFSETLDAGAGFASYSWNTSETTQSIVVDTAGIYDVFVVDGNGCIGTAAITVTENSLPTVSAGTDTNICEGETINLDPGNALLSLVWVDSTGTPVTTITTTGTYVVTGTDSNGCSAMDTLVVGKCVGINGVTQTRFSVYPNPAQNLIYIQFEKVEGMESINLYDGLGNLVKSKQVNGQDLIEISVNELSAGYYFVKVIGASSTGTSRIIVQ